MKTETEKGWKEREKGGGGRRRRRLGMKMKDK